MKKLIVVVIYVLVTLFMSFSQDDGASTINTTDQFISKIIKEKPKNYFDIKGLIKKRTITLEEAESLKNESKKANYKLGEIYALNTLGMIYRNKANYKRSLEYHSDALKIAKANDDLDAQILTLNSIGVNYRRQDDLRNALNMHQEALNVFDRIKNPTINNKKSISIAENCIGNIYITLKQYDLAIERFEKSIKIQQETNDKRGLAINNQNIGFSKEQIGFIDEALASYEKSLKYNKDINSLVGKVICTNSIVGVLIKKKNYKEALKLAEANLPFAKNLDYKYHLTQTLSTLGYAQLKNNKLKEAEATLLESLNIAKETKNKQNQITIYFYLSELYEQLDNSDKAFANYKKGIVEEQKTFNEKNISYVNNLIAKHDLQSLKNKTSSLEIRRIQLARNKNILIITLVSIALLSVALYSIYRQRLLNNDRKVLMLEQQALQTQMNPHFIFNALNSIKLYIINNEQKQAVYYLNKFSKLIRNILDVSKIKEVSLKDELHTMDLYMSIENIRFSNEINYTVNINPDLNTDTLKVPPLILQPFLENAIWHGLSSKQGHKEVVLNAKKISEDLMEITITDNGVGREVAGKIKKNKSLNRKSIGIDLTIERLKTFANDFENEFSLIYIDLKDDLGNAIGTKVCLKIPIL